MFAKTLKKKKKSKHLLNKQKYICGANAKLSQLQVQGLFINMFKDKDKDTFFAIE